MCHHLDELVEAARHFCELIESIDDADHAWLRQVSMVLPRLHAAVTALGVAPDAVGHSGENDLDDRFELFSDLRRLIGIRDTYWMEFDQAEEDSASGSLADDLTDIYYELKHNLHRLEGEPSGVLDNLRSGFRFHWGQHLVDAERHLYVLCSRNQL